MKALMCHNFYRLAGGEDQVYHDECWLLRHYGHQVVTYDVHNDALQSMGRWDAIKSTFWNRDTYRNVRQLIQTHGPDVVHCANTFPLLSPSVYDAANAEGVPVVQSLHNFRLFCPGSTLLRDGRPCQECLGKRFAIPAVIHKCYRGSRSATAVSAAMHSYRKSRGMWTDQIDRFIALTHDSKRIFVEAGLPEAKISVKANFVRPDPGVYSDKQDYAIFVGRLSAEKGIDVLIDAWESMSPQIPLKIVGDGPLADTLVARIADLPQVQWLGQRPFEEVLSLIGRARLLVFPSIWHETFGRSMIEAKATGTPVVASNLGAMAELNTDEVTGLLFQPGNAADLAAKVSRLLRDSELQSRIATAGRDQFEKHFTAEANIGTLLDVYRDAGAQIPRPQEVLV